MKKMYLNKPKKIFIGNNRGGFYGKRKRIPPVIIAIILAFALLGAAVVYSAFSTYQKKGLVKTYISNAKSYTEAQNYSSAIDEYNKALKLGGTGKDEIYRGMIYCYIKNDQTDEAVDFVKLLLARHELKDESFSETALMINSVDPASAQRLLNAYTETYGANSPSVSALSAAAASAPLQPQLDMLQGTYVRINSVKFKSDDEHFGHTVYYTTDGSAPDENSKIYRGSFSIDESTDLRAVSYNAAGEASDIALYSFTIDKEMLKTLQDLTAQARKLYNDTETGAEIGQCSTAAKDKFNITITEAEELLNRENILFMDAENSVDYINAAIEEFNGRINKETDAETLVKLSYFAEDVYAAVTKSPIANSVSSELEALKTALDAAKDKDSDVTVSYYTIYQSLLDLNFAGCRAAYKALLISENCNNYFIYDVNGDMIPELIINRGSNKENAFYTYSIEMGIAVRIDNAGNFAELARFYSNHDGLLGCTDENGSGDFYLITFVNNKMEISDKLEQYSTNETLRTSLSPVKLNASGDTSAIDGF
ncbi:MAG: chitobiase/beta-hexosaminidase C-terminal domain-containing protein [Firmicutes bacterium]|nr:chitobiase/beta-hexosaminidase C-terminal domain-containing protein [Bacillota bacterium]MBQ9605402.1 chitobiase/beta-hexosaminidase C-terminal domain-containing protein [Bacillota bacterium]